VLLFDSADVYDAQAKRLFGDEGLSPYGYYKPNRRTLVMNIATGGGTLVHELTHALIDFDFPDVPPWFNEGLASLHEQCRFREDGSGIDGLENWRLPALQKAKVSPLPGTGLCYQSVSLPKQVRETRVVKNMPVDEIAREIAAWISEE